MITCNFYYNHALLYRTNDYELMPNVGSFVTFPFLEKEGIKTEYLIVSEEFIYLSNSNLIIDFELEQK